jgi:hypothetical protein
MNITKKRLKRIILEEAKKLRRRKRLDEISAAGGIVGTQPIGIASNTGRMKGISEPGPKRMGQMYQDDRHRAFGREGSVPNGYSRMDLSKGGGSIFGGGPSKDPVQQANEDANSKVQAMLEVMDSISAMFAANGQDDVAETITEYADDLERRIYVGD